MKKSLLTLLLACITAVAFAAPYTAESLPVSTKFKDVRDFNAVCNPDGILTAADVDSLNTMLWSLREKHGVQGLVVCINESDPDDPYEFAIQVARRYGVGGKKSTGFIMLVTAQQRGMSILTGDGMEKYLTDVQCSRIERNIMAPFFKRGQWANGLMSGVLVIQSVCSKDNELLNAMNHNDNTEEIDDVTGVILFFLLFFGVAGGSIFYAVFKKRKCPQCGKLKYKLKLRTVTKVANTSTQVRVVDLYVCNACGYEHEKEYKSDTDTFYIGTFNGKGKYKWGMIMAAASTGTYFGGGGFGGGGGGSSFHSTFGGGSFSGGGASGRF